MKVYFDKIDTRVISENLKEHLEIDVKPEDIEIVNPMTKVMSGKWMMVKAFVFIPHEEMPPKQPLETL